MSKFNETPRDWAAYILFITIWNSLVAWLFIGLVYVIGGWITGSWTWDWQIVVTAWGLILLLGYLLQWLDE